MSAAIQIAKLHGARVIATAGSDTKLEQAKELGADEVINYTTHSIREQVLCMTDGFGVDLVIESVGGDVFVQSIDAVCENGRLITGVESGRMVRTRGHRLHSCAVVAQRAREVQMQVRELTGPPCWRHMGR